jgi:hypothetical protein
MGRPKSSPRSLSRHGFWLLFVVGPVAAHKMLSEGTGNPI